MENPWISSSYSCNSIQGLEYRFRSREFGVTYDEGLRCTPVVVEIDEYKFPIPCPNCTDVRGSAYLQLFRDEFADFIGYILSTIPEICVLEVVDTFATSILQPYIRDHRCPTTVAETSTVKTVVIEILQDGVDVLFEEDMEVLFEEDDDPMLTIPVSHSWLEAEVINKATEKNDLGEERFESGWNTADHECAVCFEDIPKRIDSLTMPCSHVFHEDCIVQWLKTSHLCPLCRHAMPTDD